MIKVQTISFPNSRQTFLKISRAPKLVDYTYIDISKKGFEERAAIQFERMVRMEQAQS